MWNYSSYRLIIFSRVFNFRSREEISGAVEVFYIKFILNSKFERNLVECLVSVAALVALFDKILM